ncbi:unnamed protein product [Trichobilharzia regenti]|nr:unnamed protein product [Trichobilharzia regenti]
MIVKLKNYGNVFINLHHRRLQNIQSKRLSLQILHRLLRLVLHQRILL